MKSQFNNSYTTLQNQIISRLAEIEKSDADACANCGGEDCVCCEIYHDRMKWKEPEEIFADDDYGSYNREPEYDFWCDKCDSGCDEWCDKCNSCPDCCTCE